MAEQKKRWVQRYSHSICVFEMQGEGEKRGKVCVALGTPSRLGFWHLMIIVGQEHVTTTFDAVFTDEVKRLALAAVAEKLDGAE